MPKAEQLITQVIPCWLLVLFGCLWPICLVLCLLQTIKTPFQQLQFVWCFDFDVLRKSFRQQTKSFFLQTKNLVCWLLATYLLGVFVSGNRAFQLVVNNLCYWLKWITWFVLANSRVCLLQIESLYWSVWISLVDQTKLTPQAIMGPNLGPLWKWSEVFKYLYLETIMPRGGEPASLAPLQLLSSWHSYLDFFFWRC